MVCGCMMQLQTIQAQERLDSVTVTGYLHTKTGLPEEQGTYIHSGKKTELIQLGYLNADLSSKNGRQVFAKVPGVFVYDMDGAGNQVNIATRGLDPHRGWEFNMRKNGVMINSDMYGYPASHYSMPFESIERIELVRGTGSLQYGAQFGGMLNYITKRADSTGNFGFENITTTGSYNLISSYNAVSGTLGKFRYYAYHQQKNRDGYRREEHTSSAAQQVALEYAPSRQFSLQLEWSRSAYTYKIPGALNDSMFAEDPRQATRTRNYFNPNIHVPAITIHWQINADSRLQLTSSAVLGKRNSVLFDKPTNVMDTINTATMQYNNRQVDIDRFNSYTTELRLLQHYRTRQQEHTLTAGLQYMNNDLHRTQQGKGTAGADYDLSLVSPVWGRDLHFKTTNLALFAENRFSLLKRLIVTAGARIETGRTDMSGIIQYYPANKIPLSIQHRFPLLGAGIQYRISEQLQLYGGWSQSYRPMIFKDLVPASLYEQVDPDIKDAHGYNAEIGFRGSWRMLKWDVTAFLLRENHRFGTLAQTDAANNLITYRTNIGNSRSRGLEILLEGNWQFGRNAVLSVFTSTSFMQARYLEAQVKTGNSNIIVSGNKVESAPDFTSRNGAAIRTPLLSISLLHSYVSATFADALNTVTPTPTTGAVGLVPAYGLLDLNGSVRISKHLSCKINLNNLLNKQYFTKRPLFYPGPGIWPSEGRNWSASVVIKL